MFRARALNCVHLDSSKSGDSGDWDRGQIHEAKEECSWKWGERIKIRRGGGLEQMEWATEVGRRWQRQATIFSTEEGRLTVARRKNNRKQQVLIASHKNKTKETAERARVVCRQRKGMMDQLRKPEGREEHLGICRLFKREGKGSHISWSNQKNLGWNKWERGPEGGSNATPWRFSRCYNPKKKKKRGNTAHNGSASCHGNAIITVWLRWKLATYVNTRAIETLKSGFWST